MMHLVKTNIPLSRGHAMHKRILVLKTTQTSANRSTCPLEFEDYDIHEAANADEGLVAVQQVRPNLLLDGMMPGTMDGLDLRRCIKSDPSLDLPQVVLLTARG